jgi:hypothetical protein
MSKVLNLKIHNNDMKLTFFEDVTQEDQFGLIMESHNLKKWVAYIQQNGL